MLEGGQVDVVVGRRIVMGSLSRGTPAAREEGGQVECPGEWGGCWDL